MSSVGCEVIRWRASSSHYQFASAFEILRLILQLTILSFKDLLKLSLQILLRIFLHRPIQNKALCDYIYISIVVKSECYDIIYIIFIYLLHNVLV